MDIEVAEILALYDRVYGDRTEEITKELTESLAIKCELGKTIIVQEDLYDSEDLKKQIHQALIQFEGQPIHKIETHREILKALHKLIPPVAPDYKYVHLKNIKDTRILKGYIIYNAPVKVINANQT